MGNCANTGQGGCTHVSLSTPPREEDLHLLPGRIFSNDGRSSISSVYTQQGRKGVNQDTMILWEDFAINGGILCGVFDGHGPQGHLVARKVRDALPLKLLSCFPDPNRPASLLCFGGYPADPDEEDPSLSGWRRAFARSYKAMDKDLCSDRTLDCFCSGSTSVVVLKMGMDLFIGNIGDSRAILGSKEGSSMVAVPLTVDLKPDLPREAERIKQCRGRVFALPDEPEVPRVWLPFDNAPGLAMARAFGDFCLKNYGVISDPDFSHRVLTDRDQFVILASDGVWDVVSNQEAVDIISSAPSRSSAAKRLVEAATREWKLKYPTSRMDDCAVVCLYLNATGMDCKSASEEDTCETPRLNDKDCISDEPSLDRNFTVRSGGSGKDTCETPRLNDKDCISDEPSLDRNFTVRSGGSGKDTCETPRLNDKDCISDVQSHEPSLDRNFTVRSGGSGKTSADLNDQGWSGLEGVTRANSIVQLPRFSDEVVSV